MAIEPESPRPATLSDWTRRWSGGLLSTLVKPLAALGVTPNALTVAGLLLNAGVAAVLANGYLAWGGGLILLAGVFDALDGSLARLTGQQSRFGAFLDSTLDRYSDALVFVGLAWFYLGAGARLEIPGAKARSPKPGQGLECALICTPELPRNPIEASFERSGITIGASFGQRCLHQLGFRKRG